MSEATKVKRGLDKDADLYRAVDSIQRAVNIDLGGGKTFKIEPGSLIRVSKAYKGQLGGTVHLVQPYGSKDGAGQQGSSTFTITPKQLEDNFTKIDKNSEEALQTARDDRADKNYAEQDGVPGRRSAADVEGKSEKEKEKTMKENYIDLIANQDIVNFKQTIADRLDMLAHQAIENEKYGNIQDATDQIDNTENSDQIEETAQQDDEIDQLFEQIESMDEEQFNQYINNLDEEQLDILEQLLDERYVNPKKTRRRIAREARAGEDMGKPGKMFKVIARKAGKRYGSEEIGNKVAGAVLQNIAKKKK